MSDEGPITTSEEAIARLLVVANGTYNESHNIIIESTEFGPERFVALQEATTAEVARWAYVAVALKAVGR